MHSAGEVGDGRELAAAAPALCTGPQLAVVY